MKVLLILIGKNTLRSFARLLKQVLKYDRADEKNTKFNFTIVMSDWVVEEFVPSLENNDKEKWFDKEPWL